MGEKLMLVADEAQEAIRDYFRDRAAQKYARRWLRNGRSNKSTLTRERQTTVIERAERQVFDIVAVTTSQYLPDFSTTASKNKAFHLRLLRQAIEKES